MQFLPSCLLVALTSGLTPAQADQPQPRPLWPAKLGQAVPDLASTVAKLADDVQIDNRQQYPLAKTAWLLLGFAGNGTTLREGHHRDQLKALVVSLRYRQDEAGRFLTAGKPCDREDQLLATFAIARCQLEAKYSLLLRNTRLGVQRTVAAFDAPDAAPATAREVALLAMLAETLRDSDVAELRPGVVERARAGAAKLEPHRSRLDDAAVHLTSLQLGEAHPPELTIARCWPGNLHADPFHTWLAAFAVRGLDVEHRREQWQSALQLLTRRDAGGLWPAIGGLDATTTTAMLAAALGMAYAAK